MTDTQKFGVIGGLCNLHIKPNEATLDNNTLPEIPDKITQTRLILSFP
jgi:hypothetical protein